MDLVVVGAGLYGIQAARTYLEIHPDHHVKILESSASVGGVWSTERVYDAFITQTPLGMAEFSDVPLTGVPDDEQYYDFFPAKHVTRYLEDYVKCHVYSGSSLEDRICFNSAVTQVDKTDGRWKISVVRPDGGRSEYTTVKLIDACGLTSIPNLPDLPGLKTFRGVCIHHKEFGKSTFLSDPSTKRVIVVGGAKSAADVAYAAAKAGKQVSWIIRRSGSGPAAFMTAKGDWPYHNSNESFYTRVISTFLASVFNAETRWTDFLYRTRLGQVVFRRVWGKVNKRAVDSANYERKDGKEHGFFNLKPDTPLFWQNDSTGINQRADFFDVIARKVHVIREDISRVTEQGLILENNMAIDAEAIVFATGWKSTSYPYLPDSTASQLGLPVCRFPSDVQEVKEWDVFEEEADVRIMRMFPVLTSPPDYFHSSEPPYTPYRLYKCMLPVVDHSIVFLGRVMLGNHFRAAEVQALWAVAALDGMLALQSCDDMRIDIASVIAWCRRRYLGKGRLGNWLFFDMVPYTDNLLRQLDLQSHLPRPWWKRLFAPCVARDIRGLIEEYKQKHGIHRLGRRN